jgi:hypothetical protein
MPVSSTPGARILAAALILLAESSGGCHAVRATGTAAAVGAGGAGTGEAGAGGVAVTGGAAGVGGGDGGPSPLTSKTALLSNDTSASVAFTDVYTPATRFNGSTTPVSNGDAPASTTPLSDLMRGVVSKVPIRTLLYPGATTKVFVETQAWFCTNGKVPIPTSANADQCGSHIDIGYDANASAHVKAEVADMMSRGIDGALLDWDGQGAGMGAVDQHTTDSTAVNTGNLTLVMQAAEATQGQFTFAVIEDEGIKACAAQAGCDVTQALVSDLDFLAAHSFDSPAYQKIGGRPVVYFFSVDTWAKNAGKTIDWTTVRAQAQKAPLFIFENAGGFTHAASDGAYSWLQATPIGSYPGSDPFGTAGFLPYFYQQAAAHPTLHTIGSAYKGFDDYLVNGWGGGRRYAGQQCGKTWLDTLAAAGKSYSSAHQLEALQIATWDDYEEGTEIETGIESWASINASVNGATLTWSVVPAAGAPADCTQAISAGFSLDATIHHYEVYASPAGDGENLTRVGGDLPASTKSLDLAGKLPPGAYVLYVYAVGQPTIKNHLSAAAPYQG